MSESISGAIKRPTALSDSAAEQIRKAIIEGDFDLGEALPEAKLTKSLGISKTPIREALSLLKKEGLVVTYPQRGAFVFSMTRDCIVQLCSFRYAMESVAMDMALDRARQQLLEDMADNLRDMLEVYDTADFKRFTALDTAFHDCLFHHAGNAYVSASYQMAASKVATLRTHLSQGNKRTDYVVEEHSAILEALKNNQTRKAKSVLRRHIFRGVEVYEELIPASERKGN
ncbi:GntR family transcriptional regulator [Labrenzia sp. PHM005]|uniref:GntR family transcriptional regulator n=1 Tax=Labrenzia sp. PHM005 TaxID=2590016 RepID=UPI00113FF954|nr:GntR family transcriptional regulator [Labrenzia sp. PHM005]QDG75398.1 GntR family transcriptional regulator [Labrenzia sp. PHM005]